MMAKVEKWKAELLELEAKADELLDSPFAETKELKAVAKRIAQVKHYIEKYSN